MLFLVSIILFNRWWHKLPLCSLFETYNRLLNVVFIVSTFLFAVLTKLSFKY